MDYKKKYEEALERAKVINPGTNDYNIVTEIFPELKESEDESIRKELISFITDRKNWFPKEETKASWIAWLEKQGEQKPNFCHHEVDFSNCSEEYRKGYYDGWNNCNQQHAQLEAEQKPAWSEEDEKYFNVIYKELESYIAIKGYYTPLSCADLTWLKSLKERMKGE